MGRLSGIELEAIAGAGGDAARAVQTAAEYAPYLSRVLARRPEVLELMARNNSQTVLDNACQDMAGLRQADVPLEQAMAVMRKAKEAAHFAIAGADLSGNWSLDEVTASLSRLADHAVESALAVALREAWRSGRFGSIEERCDMPGLFVLAMGKMGAGELNYSSDVDLIMLFDLDVVPVPADKIKQAMTRVAADLVKVLEERTVDGYVFRTDLRLRPDPGSTAPALSMQYALSYYESVGQNWERMAHIKARVCAGDRVVGEAYLEELTPFIWRRHLDYWAIADIHAIKRQIHSHGGHAALEQAAFDVKLGRGGIREIEFFAQVQQLILGGRLPEMRVRGTKQALALMVEAGFVDGVEKDDLLVGYDFLRRLEHRIQMLNDEQTHKLPDVPEKRAQVAKLCGYDDVVPFERDVAEVRGCVHETYSNLFALEENLSSSVGNLVFTGVDDDPGTLETLSGMGFSDPSKIIKTFREWHRGNVLATRSARGRQLLTTLGPKLLEVMCEVGEPDVAFARFSEFFSRLSAGVQTMSLLLAEPALTRELILTMSFAPKLGMDLARQPALLDAMLEPSFLSPIGKEASGERAKVLANLLEGESGFEAKINAARRFHREEAFRIGYQVLHGEAGARDAGVAYADLADACVGELAKVAEQEVLAKFDGEIGRWAVCAQGKFGGRELTATSDLDLMLIFESDTPEGGALATRFVQRLVAALSAPTEEGLLYEVDMQLRPSGKAGPVAVKFGSFERYYQGDAWTWEFMALTRLRPMAGDPDLIRRICAVKGDALRAKSDDPVVTKDVLDMRNRLARERPAKSKWNLKLTPGGLVDIEFIVQHAILMSAGRQTSEYSTSTEVAIGQLLERGVLEKDEASALQGSLGFQLDLQQAQRIGAGDDFDPAKASDGLKVWLSKLLKCPGIVELEQKLDEFQQNAAEIRARRIGIVATESR